MCKCTSMIEVLLEVGLSAHKWSAPAVMVNHPEMVSPATMFSHSEMVSSAETVSPAEMVSRAEIVSPAARRSATCACACA